PLGGIHDIREGVERAAREMPLVPQELLDVSQTVSSARRIKTFLQKRRDTAPLLAESADNLPVLTNIESRVDEAIADGGEVRDTATPELARIRSQLKTVQARLRDRTVLSWLRIRRRA